MTTEQTITANARIETLLLQLSHRSCEETDCLDCLIYDAQFEGSSPRDRGWKEIKTLSQNVEQRASALQREIFNTEQHLLHLLEQREITTKQQNVLALICEMQAEDIEY